MNLSNPAPGRPVTSGYGYRIDPFTKKKRKHRGVDFGGTFKVKAAADGKVVDVIDQPSKRNGYGHGLLIRHSATLYTLYAHGAHRPAFKKGDRVRRGQTLFISGSTGASTGPHLHFEVRRSPLWGTDVNPAPYLAAPAKPAPKPAAPRVHVVKSGETLGGIAKRYGTTWQKLHAANRSVIGPNPNVIRPGQRLVIK